MEVSKVVYLDDIKHGVRVANLSLAIGKIYKMSDRKQRHLYLAGLFHDIGKAYVDQDIINKPGALTRFERNQIEEHVEYSSTEVLKMGYSEDIAYSIKYHHESYDGTGYPGGLKGDEIPFNARILKICDVYDALTSDRVYRERLGAEQALRLMQSEREKYDPEIFRIFMHIIDRQVISYESLEKERV